MFQPLFHKFYHRMTRGMRIFICIALILIFVADAAYSIIRPNAGKNITCIFVSDIIP